MISDRSRARRPVRSRAGSRWLRPRTLSVSALLLAIACGAPEPPLNLIVILVDTTRSDHLGYQGYARPTSPRIDALASESVAFLNHYSHASRTGPSVASLFTGLHPRSHGVVNPLTHWDAKGTLAPDQTTLAEILAAHGYRCYGIVTNVNVSARFGFAQGFERYDFLRDRQGARVNTRVVGLGLREHDGPFFLYLHYMEPHSSYEAPAPYSAMFAEEGYTGPITGSHEQLDRIVGGEIRPDDADRAHLAALYDQEIRYFDDLLGDLLAYLEETGLLDSSILVFVADHGEELLDHGSVLHGYTLYEEQLRVPLLIRDPRRREPRRVEAVTRHVDMLPTLLELLGIPAEPSLQGASLVPLMDGEAAPAERPVFAEASLRAVKTIQGRSLRSGAWKLIETRLPWQREELFDLSKDPGEQRDLIAAEPGVAARMRERLEAFERDLPVGRGGVVELTREETEQLRALGYLK